MDSVSACTVDNVSVRTLTDIPTHTYCGPIQRLELFGINCTDDSTDNRKMSRVIQVELKEGRLVRCSAIVNSSRDFRLRHRLDKSVDLDLSSCSPARDRYEQNVEIIRDVTSCATFMRTTRHVTSGQELFVWFSEELSREFAVPIISPSNITVDQRYICTRCSETFLYPNPLKAHIRFHCPATTNGCIRTQPDVERSHLARNHTGQNDRGCNDMGRIDLGRLHQLQTDRARSLHPTLFNPISSHAQHPCETGMRQTLAGDVLRQSGVQFSQPYIPYEASQFHSSRWKSDVKMTSLAAIAGWRPHDNQDPLTPDSRSRRTLTTSAECIVDHLDGNISTDQLKDDVVDNNCDWSMHPFEAAVNRDRSMSRKLESSFLIRQMVWSVLTPTNVTSPVPSKSDVAYWDKYNRLLQRRQPAMSPPTEPLTLMPRRPPPIKRERIKEEQGSSDGLPVSEIDLSHYRANDVVRDSLAALQDFHVDKLSRLEAPSSSSRELSPRRQLQRQSIQRSRLSSRNHVATSRGELPSLRRPIRASNKKAIIGRYLAGGGIESMKRCENKKKLLSDLVSINPLDDLHRNLSARVINREAEIQQQKRTIKFSSNINHHDDMPSAPTVEQTSGSNRRLLPEDISDPMLLGSKSPQEANDCDEEGEEETKTRMNNETLYRQSLLNRVISAATIFGGGESIDGSTAVSSSGGSRAGGGGGGRKGSNYVCVYCGKIYSRKYGLKIHVRTHTGYKPLKCRVCQRPFGDPSNLNKHIRLHAEGDTPYRCRHCGKVLVRRRDLERHVRSRHIGEHRRASVADDGEESEGERSWDKVCGIGPWIGNEFGNKGQGANGKNAGNVNEDEMDGSAHTTVTSSDYLSDDSDGGTDDNDDVSGDEFIDVVENDDEIDL